MFGSFGLFFVLSFLRSSIGVKIPCDEETGLAGSYPCKNVDIESIADFETLTSIGGSVPVGSALTTFAKEDGSPHEMCDFCNPFNREGTFDCFVARIDFFLRFDTCSNPFASIPDCTSQECNDVELYCSDCEPYVRCMYANNFEFEPCVESYFACTPAFTQLCNIGNQGADIWGFSEDGRDFAAICLAHSTAFLEVTDAANPQFLGYMPSTPGTFPSLWCDVKIVRDANNDPILYKVTEGAGHGVQVLNLAGLLNVSTPQMFVADEVIGNSSAHNVAANDESGMVYVVGQFDCYDGMTVLNKRTGVEPACYTLGAYVHDAVCVTYNGPDTAYQGQEICVLFTPFALRPDLTLISGDAVQIYAVETIGSNVNFTLISSFSYPNEQFSHQGWFSEDHRYLIFADELDELVVGINTTTHIYDLANLSSPIAMVPYVANISTVDHNLYIFEGRVFQSDYTSGLRVFDFDPQKAAAQNSPALTEVAFLETATEASRGKKEPLGAFSSFQFAPTNGGTAKVVVNTFDLGVFIVTVDPQVTYAPSNSPSATPAPTIGAPATAAPVAAAPTGGVTPEPSSSGTATAVRGFGLLLVSLIVAAALLVDSC